MAEKRFIDANGSYAWRKIIRVRRAMPPKRYGVLPPETICEIMRGTAKWEKKTYEK